jgi:hypothetical protein
MTAAHETFRICQAEDFSGTMWCGRCNISWPTGATGDDVPDCKPKADPPITLGEMITVAHDQAHADIVSQVTMVNAGLRTAPDLITLRKCAVMQRIVTLLERVKGEPGLIERLRES